ncbi:hypothetical protein DFH06DRAFT_1337403 [Mycena polygramma]|nr:hypothetical protein DFH06DRAFT_1337403 [Mycena polygramma]
MIVYNLLPAAALLSTLTDDKSPDVALESFKMEMRANGRHEFSDSLTAAAGSRIRIIKAFRASGRSLFTSPHPSDATRTCVSKHKLGIAATSTIADRIWTALHIMFLEQIFKFSTLSPASTFSFSEETIVKSSLRLNAMPELTLFSVSVSVVGGPLRARLRRPGSTSARVSSNPLGVNATPTADHGMKNEAATLRRALLRRVLALVRLRIGYRCWGGSALKLFWIFVMEMQVQRVPHHRLTARSSREAKNTLSPFPLPRSYPPGDQTFWGIRASLSNHVLQEFSPRTVSSRLLAG